MLKVVVGIGTRGWVAKCKGALKNNTTFAILPISLLHLSFSPCISPSLSFSLSYSLSLFSLFLTSLSLSPQLNKFYDSFGEYQLTVARYEFVTQAWRPINGGIKPWIYYLFRDSCYNRMNKTMFSLLSILNFMIVREYKCWK